MSSIQDIAVVAAIKAYAESCGTPINYNPDIDILGVVQSLISSSTFPGAVDYGKEPRPTDRPRSPPRVNRMSDVDLEAASAALISLATDNIPPDVQELLVHGDPKREIRPGALSRAIQALLIVYGRAP